MGKVHRARKEGRKNGTGKKFAGERRFPLKVAEEQIE